MSSKYIKSIPSFHQFLRSQQVRALYRRVIKETKFVKDKKQRHELIMWARTNIESKKACR